MATRDNRPIAFGDFRWAWWTGEAGTYAVTIYVDPGCLRQGIGVRLFALIRSRLRLRGVARIVSWIPADVEAGRGFVTHLGLEETGQIIQEYRLSVPEADTGAYPRIEARLLQEGVRIIPLSELSQEDPAFLYTLQQLWADAGEAPPSPDQLRNSFATWRQQVLDGPACRLRLTGSRWRERCLSG